MPRKNGKSQEPELSLSGPPTLRHIARITGLAIATVSRALNDGAEIAPATKERVRSAAKAIGYQANPSAVRLRTGRSNIIVLLHDLEENTSGFSDRMIFGISEVLGNTPYRLMVLPQKSQSGVESLREIIANRTACGVILSKIEPKDARVSLLHEAGMPFVTHGRTELTFSHPFHDFDNEAFAFNALAELASLGRKKIALIAPSKRQTYHAHVQAGFAKGLETFGLQSFPTTLSSYATPDEVRQGVGLMMLEGFPPDGIVACNASSAVAALAGAADAGKMPGIDLEIVGKTYSRISTWATPSIRWIYEDLHLAGERLGSIIVDAIEGNLAENASAVARPSRLKAGDPASERQTAR